MNPGIHHRGIRRSSTLRSHTPHSSTPHSSRITAHHRRDSASPLACIHLWHQALTLNRYPPPQQQQQQQYPPQGLQPVRAAPPPPVGGSAPGGVIRARALYPFDVRRLSSLLVLAPERTLMPLSGARSNRVELQVQRHHHHPQSAGRMVGRRA